QIAGGIAINDAAILRFDFEPTEPQVTFRYVFASEEYCDYVNSPFNDAFGFFLSGPGINGPYSGQAINIATLPNGTAVAINSVNHQTNPGFYVGNIPAGDPQLNDPDCAGHPIAAGQTVQDCQYDGWTTILTAVANVIPCETYSIKLAVGDGGDNAFDSAVFLEANSFAAGGTAEVIASVPVTQSGDAYEGCGDAYFVFNRSGGDPSQPLVINFTVGGTATAGVDYNSTITTGSITIPPFQNSVQIPVFIINDLITEGAESIILTLKDPCNCTNAVGMMFILDKHP
ncbi:MAG: choice-of-anchor L domain-containing protein, partial [Saprospiraceae bacterium]|nr:choice-of-anchor L domain-containing protein [Saprospiraceae bacterium]